MHNVSETLSSQRRQSRRRTPIVFLSVAQNPRAKEEEFILNSLVIMSRVLRDMECYIFYISLSFSRCVVVDVWCSEKNDAVENKMLAKLDCVPSYPLMQFALKDI